MSFASAMWMTIAAVAPMNVCRAVSARRRASGRLIADMRRASPPRVHLGMREASRSKYGQPHRHMQDSRIARRGRGPETEGMNLDAASVDSGPGASIAEPLPARAQALPAETRSPSPRLPLAASVSDRERIEGAVNRMVAAPSTCDDQDCVPVLIVDDHPSFRANARALLEAEGFEVVGEAEDGASALRAVHELSPELVLLDVQLPDLDGLEVARRLTEDGGPAVVLVSSRDGSDFGPLVERSGARGFIPKAELSGAALSALLA